MTLKKLKTCLFISLILNTFLIFLFAYKLYKNWFEIGVLKDPFRTSLFNVLPKEKDKIYFVGDSHTEAFELNELFHNQNVRNRGIWGDVSSNVLKRMDNIIDAQPKKLFLMIGVNDICSGFSMHDVTSNVEKIIITTKNSLPKTQIYLESVLPTNQKILHSEENTVNKIQQLNAEYNRLSKKYKVTYIDLFAKFLSNEGLKTEYSFDGLHLNGLGYLKLTELLKPYVDER